MIHPLILGEGKRFFEGVFSTSSWKLLDAGAAETGVVIAGYAAA